MKKTIILLCYMVLFLMCQVTLAETYYRNGYDYHPYYHVSDRCALICEPVVTTTSTIKEDNLEPCPICVPDGRKYLGIEACERGGTVVIRIPDDSLTKEINADALPVFLPDELIHATDRDEDDLARLVHGKMYLACLAMSPGDEKTVDVFIPEPQLADGDLLMSKRHLGASWYFVIRQNKVARQAMVDSNKFKVSFLFYHARLRVRRWPAGFTLEDSGDTICRQVSLQLKVKHSANKVAYDSKADPDDEQAITVFKDRDVYTCVVYDRRKSDATRTHYWTRFIEETSDWIELSGYISKNIRIFCFVLTEGEISLLQDDRISEIYLSDNPLISAYPPTAVGIVNDLDYQPVTQTILKNGSIAKMIQTEYPIGTPFLRYSLLRPDGGIAFYEASLSLERLSGNGWRRIAHVYCQNGPEIDQDGLFYSGWYCDEVQLVVPLIGIRALAEGLYRLEISDQWGEGDQWLEFTVRDGAPQPELPTTRTTLGKAICATHSPPYALSNYNSCQDCTHRKVDECRELLLVENTVFDLRRYFACGDNVDWDEWCYGSLFCYPLGHQEQAELLRENIPMFSVSIYDGGKELLIVSQDVQDSLYRMDYSGKNLRAAGEFFQKEAQAVEEILLAGDVAYFAARETELWCTKLDTIQPVQVGYDILRKDYGWDPFTEDYRPWRCLQYADRILLAANDNGILAIDTTASDTQGHMPYKRLTSAYDYDEDVCGMGYIALNGRLYCWSEEDQATISMKLDGNDRQVVSREHFYFSGVSSKGAVLAMTDLTHKGPFHGCESARLYLPDDPANPNFDPDHCRAYTLPATGNTFLFGDYLWQIPVDGSAEILTPLSDIQPD